MSDAAIDPATLVSADPSPRHRTIGVRIGAGKGAVMVGGGAPVGQLNGFADLVPEEGFINYDDPNCVPYDVGYHPQCMGHSALMLMRGSYNLVTDKPPPPPPTKNCKVVLSSRPRR